MVKQQINKASALHNAQITHTSYRGVEYDTRCVESKESHGTFCYRGRTYTKWFINLHYREGYKPSLFLSLSNELTNVSELTQTILNSTELKKSYDLKTFLY
jgi:hypothetical protein